MVRRRPRPTRFLLLMGLVQTLSTLTIDIYLPAFPRIAAELDASDIQMQLTFSAAMIGMLAGGLVGGSVSDAVGRRRTMLAAVVVHAVASVTCGVAPAIEALIAARTVQGFAAAALSVIVLASVRDTHAGRSMVRSLALIAVVSGLAIAAGPAIGALMLSVMTWRWVFVVLGAYALVLGAVVALRLRETLNTSRGVSGNPRRLLTAFSLLFADRLFVGLMLVGGFVWAGQYAYLASSSLVFQVEFALDELGYSLVFASHALFMLTGNQLGAWAVQRTTPLRLLTISAFILTGATAAIAVAGASHSQLAGVLPLLWLFTLALGAINPCLQSLALTRHGTHAGAASSLLTSASLALGAIASPLSSLGGVVTLQGVATTMFACQLVALIIMLAAVRPSARRIQGEWTTE